LLTVCTHSKLVAMRVRLVGRERAHHRHAYAYVVPSGRAEGDRAHLCRLAVVFHLEIEQPAQRLLARGVHGDGQLLRLVGADGATVLERGAQACRRVRVEKRRIEHPVLEAWLVALASAFSTHAAHVAKLSGVGGSVTASRVSDLVSPSGHGTELRRRGQLAQRSGLVGQPRQGWASGALVQHRRLGYADRPPIALPWSCRPASWFPTVVNHLHKFGTRKVHFKKPTSSG